eukprot:6580915-Lingulodinium_polyedra.AAC.1
MAVHRLLETICLTNRMLYHHNAERAQLPRAFGILPPVNFSPVRTLVQTRQLHPDRRWIPFH